MNIAILGGGSWGTALAIHLAKNGHPIKIWEFFTEQAQEMQEQRKCPLLPEVRLPEKIFVSSELREVVTTAELIIVAVPSDKVKATMEKTSPFLDSQPVIVCSKGFADDCRLLSEIVQEKVEGDVYCLYGPTHAEEVCKGLLSGIVLAGEGKEKEKIKKVIESRALIVELSDDIIGVQVCAALKNVLAVFVGVLDGKGFGDNAKAYIMTKGLQEIKAIGIKWGAKEETIYSLAGLGDIIVTCSSRHSRNRYLGQEVGKGRKLDEVVSEMKMVAEGIMAIKNAYSLEKKFGLNLPLITGIYQILFEGKVVEEVLERL